MYTRSVRTAGLVAYFYVWPRKNNWPVNVRWINHNNRRTTVTGFHRKAKVSELNSFFLKKKLSVRWSNPADACKLIVITGQFFQLSLYMSRGRWGQSLPWFPLHKATSLYECFCIPHQHGMPVHHGVTPRIKFTSTHLYTWVERGTVRVKCLSQIHNTTGSNLDHSIRRWAH